MAAWPQLYAPSLGTDGRTGQPPDAGRSGAGFIFDYYWGMELYPRIWGVDVKKFVNCRFSMSYWQLAGISFAYRSYTLHGNQLDPGLVLVALSQYLPTCLSTRLTHTVYALIQYH